MTYKEVYLLHDEATFYIVPRFTVALRQDSKLILKYL